MTSFHALGLSDHTLAAVASCGFSTPTPIQARSIPAVLMGRDVLGSAQTGTGKTASFTLPMIDILSSGRAKAKMPRSLILTPTRELAIQVADSFQQFSQNHALTTALIIGGVGFSDQNAKLDRGVDVLIATPGRLLDHIERGKILLNDVKILVIDEADRMLDMGFIPDVERIVGRLPKIRQTLFFSATLDDTIYKIADSFVINPKIIEISPESRSADTVAQFAAHTTARQKRETLIRLLRQEQVATAFIFCNRKRDISSLTGALRKAGFAAQSLHGDMTQEARNAALSQFKGGEVNLLVASDVAARGIDIEAVSHVFNYDVPMNPEDYIHRIGRTGRAGKSGRAFVLVAGEDDNKGLLAIEAMIGKAVAVVGGKGGAGNSAPKANGAANAKATSNGKSPSATHKKSSPSASHAKPAKSANRGSGGRGGRMSRPPRPPRISRRPLNRQELPSPKDCSGDNFSDSQHTPAFLRDS
ncbi:MAG: DEAD/DEAH box helicase [Proteobacteria bacterium]|nr:DEAD/DEAH box helicase [Pseudomonadota bacterium]